MGMLNKAKANPVPLYKRTTREKLLKAIRKCRGMTSLLVVMFDCNFKQLYNAIDKFDLRDELEAAKQMFLDQAKMVLVDAMESTDKDRALKAATTVYGKSNPTTIVQTNVTVDLDKQVKDIFGI